MLAQRVVLVDIQNNKRTRGNCISLSRCICICIYSCSCSCICCSNCISVPAAFPFDSTGYNFLPFAYFIMTATPRVVKDEEARRERGWGCQAVERERERECSMRKSFVCALSRVKSSLWLPLPTFPLLPLLLRPKIDDQTMIKIYLLLFFMARLSLCGVEGGGQAGVGKQCVICLMIMLINYESITL